MANIGYIQLIRECNQSCLFCSNPDNSNRLDFESFKIKVDDFIDKDYQGVILTGGEPTLVEYLPQAIGYCREKGMPVRMITNGQKIHDRKYFKLLVDAGLQLVHVSLYSYKPDVQDYLSANPGSFTNIISSLRNTLEMGVPTNVNTVINAYNADHLDKTTYYIIKNFPHVNHFIFNNVDPYMNRASKNRHTIPKLRSFKLSLNKALHVLNNHGKTFRVERVPLCYMGDFPQVSTETRKIVKHEERIVHFLDTKGTVTQTSEWFKHKKAPQCSSCSLDSICAGLYALGEYYDESELEPQSVDPQVIIKAIKQKQ